MNMMSDEGGYLLSCFVVRSRLWVEIFGEKRFMLKFLLLLVFTVGIHAKCYPSDDSCFPRAEDFKDLEIR